MTKLTKNIQRMPDNMSKGNRVNKKKLSHQVDLHVVDVEGDLPDGLGRVRVEEDLPAAADFADFFDRLDDPDLVVDLEKKSFEIFSRV
jgi:hypothetical protein